MYVTLPGIATGQSIELLHTIDNSNGQLEVALCDVTYHPRWTNINAARGNNKIHILGENDVIDKYIIIPDGYYIDALSMMTFLSLMELVHTK